MATREPTKSNKSYYLTAILSISHIRIIFNYGYSGNFKPSIRKKNTYKDAPLDCTEYVDVMLNEL